MARRKELSRMSPAEISKLTPQELMRYNHPLPEFDYENPDQRTDYPRMKYGLSADRTELITRVCEEEDQERELGDGWYDSPMDFGIVTCPAAPAIARGSFTMKLTEAQQAEIRRILEQEEQLHKQTRDATAPA